MTVLVIAEHHNLQLASSTLCTITAATQLDLDKEIKVLVAGVQLQPIVEKLQKINGVNEILVAEHPCYQHALAEAWAPLIVHASQQMKYILAPATTFGKNLLPRAAALLSVSQISDIIEVVNANTYKRPIYAGNAIATVCNHEPIQVITVRPSAFSPAVADESISAPVVTIDFTVNQTQSKFIRQEQQESSRPDLSAAEIIIAGGRGLGSKKNFERLALIADRIHAALGASRAAVDAGFAPNDWQVGQTGKIVAPKLYIAVGISGAIQHLAGMKESKIIVAINRDPDAPIFQIADYGIVADIATVLDEWEQVLNLT